MLTSLNYDSSYPVFTYTLYTGKQPQLLAPLQDLRVDDLRKELRARGYDELDKHKPELQTDLKNLLKGVNSAIPATTQPPTKFTRSPPFKLFSNEL
jgi:hypothetical protein